uniref:Uncharacterized protein n=1 Tax=Solanum tuberosum TaxID=4113 RepID=M1BP39_SOLTU
MVILPCHTLDINSCLSFSVFQILAVLLPILGLGAFIWWAGRDIVQSACPNCGNEFQIFRSTLNDEVQLCPFCTQPFSVVGNKFVRDPVTFSNQSTTFGQAFGDFSTRSKKEIIDRDYGEAAAAEREEDKNIPHQYEEKLLVSTMLS